MFELVVIMIMHTLYPYSCIERDRFSPKLRNAKIGDDPVRKSLVMSTYALCKYSKKVKYTALRICSMIHQQGTASDSKRNKPTRTTHIFKVVVFPAPLTPENSYTRRQLSIQQ